MADSDDDLRFGYYLTGFADYDYLPFTLDGWAAFLAGSTDWHDQGLLAEDGQVFAGERHSFRYAPATHGEDGWQIPDPPPGHVYQAVAYASGDGWDEDAIGATLTEILGILLRCDTDGEQWIVFRKTTSEKLTFRFKAEGPQLLVEAPN